MIRSTNLAYNTHRQLQSQGPKWIVWIAHWHLLLRFPAEVAVFQALQPGVLAMCMRKRFLAPAGQVPTSDSNELPSTRCNDDPDIAAADTKYTILSTWKAHQSFEPCLTVVAIG